MNSLGSSKEIVQNKLIIMYILDRINMPVSNNNITRLVLETRLMNYFIFQQCLNELYEGEFIKLAGIAGDSGRNCDRLHGMDAGSSSGKISSETSNEQSCGFILTPAGKNTLQYFLNLIPPGIRRQLDKKVPCAQKEIQFESLVTADFTPESEDKYIVECKMEEKSFPLIELKAYVGTKKDARDICENWKNHSAEIYAEIIESLIKNRD